MPDYSEYLVKLNGSSGNPYATGTPRNNQTINFDGLKDIEGNSLPATFKTAPLVRPGISDDGTLIYIPSDPTTTSFKISRGSQFPTGVTNFTVDIAIAGVPDASPIGYTLNELLHLLAYYVRGLPFADGKVFLTELLNQGQDDLVRDANYWVLNELYKTLEGETLSSGAFSLTGLSVPIFNYDKGIILVKVINGDNEYYAGKRSFDQFRRHVNLDDKYEDYDETEPIYYLKGNNLYPEPYDSSTTIDFTYLKAPRVMVFDVDGTNHINSELNKEKQRIMMGFALRHFVDANPQIARLFGESLDSFKKLNDQSPSDSSKWNKFDGDILGLGVGRSRRNILNYNR